MKNQAEGTRSLKVLRSRNSINKNTVFFLIIICIGFLVRIYKLGARDLWHDEAVSYIIVKLFSVNPKLFILVGPHPPLYEIILSAWIYLMGETEFVLRLLSVIFGMISIVLTYKIGNLYGNIKIGIVSAAFMAVSPIHIWYSQEARGYAMLTTLILARMYYFLGALIKGKTICYKFFTIYAILSIYTHSFSLVLLLPEIIILLFKKHKNSLKKWLFSYALILISFLLYLPIFLEQFKAKTFFWVPKPVVLSIFNTFTNITVGYNADKLTRTITCVYLSLCVLGFFRLKGHCVLAWLLRLVIFLPISAIFLFSKFYVPIYVDRYLMTLAPAYYILTAAGLVSIKNVFVKSLLAACTCLLLFQALSNYFLGYSPVKRYAGVSVGVPPKKPFNSAVKYVNKNLREGDIIAHTLNNTLPAFYYYFVKNKRNIEEIRAMSRIIYIPGSLNSYFHGRVTKGLGFPLVSQISIDPSKGCSNIALFKRIWLISAAMDRGELHSNGIAVRDFMLQKCKLVETKNIDGIYIDLYTQCCN